ncbi:MAG: ABC transporter substrate-binding protein [SAR202 cluster bacterium]|jgi:4,5-dihydroxyphthalate decarboxylase|nr:MAG: ABC transporter substrate-binding protein [SAR202 cluster bacterium]
MPDLSLQTAMVSYGHTKPLIDGTVHSDRINLVHVPVSPIPTAFRRMVRGLEYDVSEMAMSTYLCALAHHKQITAFPAFVLRRFEHDEIYYNTKSGIESPADLIGRKVGLRSYTFTPGVWARGILHDAYGVNSRDVTWVLYGDEHVSEYKAPDNVIPALPDSDMVADLLSGKIDAAIRPGKVNSSDIKPLIPNADEAAQDYFLQTGIYPISHAMVVKNELLKRHPWIADELYSMFKSGKERYLKYLDTANDLDSEDQAISRMKQIIGPDPLPYGIESNRKSLQAFMDFNVQQGIIPESFKWEDIFTPV